MVEVNKVDEGANDVPVTDQEARRADVEAAQQNRVAKDQSFVSTQRRLQNGPYDTADGGDLNVGWTVQHGTAMPGNFAENLPGQVFSVDQLPDPEVARAGGLPPQQISPEYVVEGDEAFSHPSGPSAGELLQAEQRKAVSEGLGEQQKAVFESDQVAASNRVPGGDGAEDAAKKDEAVRVEAAKQSSLDGGNNSGTAGENGQPGAGRADSTATGDKVAE